MTEADLFRQYAKEAMRWSSSKSTSADEKRVSVVIDFETAGGLI